jgi:serpin B
VESLDFEGNPRNAANTINAWVNDKTHAKIPEILRDVSRETVVVLTDAVYFKGRWSMPFAKTRLRPGPFICGAAIP